MGCGWVRGFILGLLIGGMVAAGIGAYAQTVPVDGPSEPYGIRVSTWMNAYVLKVSDEALEQIKTACRGDEYRAVPLD